MSYLEPANAADITPQSQRGLNFGFFFDYDMTYAFVSIFQALSRRLPKSRASGFVVNDRYYEHAVQGLPKKSSLIKFYDLVETGRRYVPTEEELAEYRKFDDHHRLARVAYSDRFLNQWTYEELIPLYIYLIAEIRKYVETQKPDVFIFDAVASQFSHLLYLVLKDMGVRIFIPFHFGVEDLYYFYDNPYFNCEEMWTLFRAMQDGAEQPSPEERQWADQFISRIRKGDNAYRNIAVGLEQRKFLLPNIGKPLYYARYLQNYFRYDRSDPTLPNPLQRITTVFRLRRNRKKTWKYFMGVNEIASDFVFLPLQYEPEIATLILTQLDQASFIDLIVRQLPWNCKLVIKEHPAMVGQRHWTFFKNLMRKYPNIQFVDPGISANHLARQARATVTLSGTAILETLVLRRPIIFVSRSRFGGFGLGVLFEDLLNFGAALKLAPTRIPSEADIVNLLSSIYRKCARFQLSETLGNPAVLEPDNIDKIAAAIFDRLKAA